MKQFEKYIQLFSKKQILDALNIASSREDFWKILNVVPLRTNRGSKEFEEYFCIDIQNSVEKNRKNEVIRKENDIMNTVHKCLYCGKAFSWNDRPYAKCCSKTCTAKYAASFTDGKKISNTLLKKQHIIHCCECGKELHVKVCAHKKLCDECLSKKLNRQINVCQWCGKEFTGSRYKKTCSEKCRRLLTSKSIAQTQQICQTLGGKRTHSGRGKKGRYHGIWCDSSWELAWVIYQEEHCIQLKRYHGYFEYKFEGKIHKYYPDFQLEDGTIVEIKGYESKQWKAKLDYLPKSSVLQILGKNEMKPILDYVISKYGKDFISLYEK